MGIHSPTIDIQSKLISQVQHNCDISDANHAGNYTLCIYLLKMREYYRWIHGLDFSDNFESAEMSQWLRNKEDIWDQVIDEPYKPIVITEKKFDIFDNEGINKQLSEHNLFYHAGIGHSGINHFFAAELSESYQLDGNKITISGKEFARDLTSPPAMSTQSEIVVRQESLKRMCWERYQEWQWSQLENPMGKALSFYPFDQSIPDALQQMVESEQNTLIQHEIGEMKITRLFGKDWPEMMIKLLGSKAELMARAVRDHLADCISTLPYLIEKQNPASIHFFFANLTYMRKDIFPSAINAYQQWANSGDISVLTDLTQRSASHWQQTMQSILEINQLNAQNPATEIMTLIESSKI